MTKLNGVLHLNLEIEYDDDETVQDRVAEALRQFANQNAEGRIDKASGSYLVWDGTLITWDWESGA